MIDWRPCSCAACKSEWEDSNLLEKIGIVFLPRVYDIWFDYKFKRMKHMKTTIYLAEQIHRKVYSALPGICFVPFRYELWMKPLADKWDTPLSVSDLRDVLDAYREAQKGNYTLLNNLVGGWELASD